ncbi:MAG: hypothetical protein LWX83_11970 [Anaerolineae bacterium]|nr:hypothetical protein [Anaerolineae bacterium]
MDITPGTISSAIEQAKKSFNEGDYEHAAALFENIYQVYTNIGDALNAAENKNNASVAFLKADQPQKALDVVAGSDLVFAAAGDLKRQAMALGNQAAAFEGLGELDKAMSSYQQASDLFKQAGENELRSYVLKSISALEMRRGKVGEAMVSMQTAIDAQKSPSVMEKFLRWLLKFIFKN